MFQTTTKTVVSPPTLIPAVVASRTPVEDDQNLYTTHQLTLMRWAHDSRSQGPASHRLDQVCL